MVDLRPTPTTAAPVLTVRASAGAELLRFMGVLVDLDGSSSYDVGPDRIEQLRARLPATVLEELLAIEAIAERSFHVLSLLGADLPEPAGVDELLDLLEADLAVGWRLMLGHKCVDAERGGLELGERIADGDEAALQQVRAWSEHERPEPVATLLRHEPEGHGRRVVAAIRAVRPLWEELERESLSAIGRDVEHRQAQLDAGRDAGQVVLEATNGYELSGDPEVRRIVLLPSYWVRPWLVVGRRLDAEVLSTVVADEFLSLPAEAPSPALLKLFKALADESRLKLLRRMTAGPISLGEATEELEVAKATAHHHLSILRQAGLVTTRGEGRGSRYSLREEPTDLAREALERYLHPQR